MIVFEYWRELRHTDYFNAMLEAGVQAFFDKYGDTSLTGLLDELGVTRELMLGCPPLPAASDGQAAERRVAGSVAASASGGVFSGGGDAGTA